MKDTKYIFKIIAVALLIKIFLFCFLVIHAPQSRFQNDSQDYIETSQVLSSQIAFAKIRPDGSLKPELFRTPGYPVFLASLHGLMKLPFNAVIFIQILLTLLVALITYKTAVLIDPGIALLSAVIILYDPPISIFSLIILSETLFLFLMSLFMLAFVAYLKNNKFYLLIPAALLLVAATYTRPVSYYLGIAVTLFIIYANLRIKNIKKAVTHALIFLILVYSLFGLWESRNHKLTGTRMFSIAMQGAPSDFGLFKSLPWNKDSPARKSEPISYYIKTASRSFWSLMTRPGPFKYFRSPAVSVIGRILAYPWMIFWFAGFIFGMARAGRNIYYQFMLLVIAYFILATIVGVSLSAGERYRVPIMPFLAVISAYGWIKISGYFKKEC